MSSSALGWSSTISYTGSLANPEDLFQTTVRLSSPGTLTLQTWGFGGGTNAASHPIAPGGFDPLVAVFTGAAATSLVNGTADDLTNYSSFAGCPPLTMAP
ncbi:MAG: DVUA0089 family protein [Acidobacteriaceae bacterium]|nr:DVUA0089 family protein [Acidobacteriaceae bacterium]